jgi:hypothetical protein
MTDAGGQTSVVDMLDVGSTATLSAASGEELRGEVLALDQATGLLTLKQPGSTPFHSNLRILRIQDVQSVSAVAPGTSNNGKLPYIDPQRCKDREERAVAAAELEAAKVGVDVTPEAQAIFNGLAKTLPCRWQGATIVVLDEVSLGPPYDAASCKQLAPNAKLFDRIQKVLSNERSKLGLK